MEKDHAVMRQVGDGPVEFARQGRRYHNPNGFSVEWVTKFSNATLLTEKDAKMIVETFGDTCVYFKVAKTKPARKHLVLRVEVGGVDNEDVTRLADDLGNVVARFDKYAAHLSWSFHTDENPQVEV
jgi:hypothetical protein